MKKAQKVRIGISIGDLNGIGSEIILKTFQDPRMLEFCTPVIFANTKLLSFYKKHFKLNVNFQGIENASKVIDGKINVVNVWKENTKINFGKEDKFLGKFTVKSLEGATEALIKKEIDTLVTAPINKNVIQSEEFNFPGHTDYLAKAMKGDSLMLMICKNLRIGLLTDHVAVKDVAEKITPELIQKKVTIIHDTLKKDFRIQKPKIAVLGINPHSGDNGVIGKEDEEILKPTILKINEKGTLVYGPYSADSFFGTKNYQNFDAVIAAYHDQGLIPFKTLSFGRGVNYTAGLSRIRTSPDHGTAYEIAGKGEADFTSFKEAVFASIEIFKCRKEYLKLTKNQLQKQSKKL
ncbi:4-hydroxythreonine-4-phosphate dehydrogenase PdxA [Mesonia mobilis]|uniref:4-hydroxythreonine-4-phosphate dehydrogenase n=1 Tax=Mesonia mobilis TaxID=369791 RepID=A0ABQ3BWK2_9FLAO|nr:4-hydroxythreonine-4-phosphate dehydrogenase PdxA [Mesonia mobilis]MBQ0739052.1 4-hydroxythreonine-4-phosphate dehydrogenase PdxA [Aquimarina celericrescens]GGZ59829.1 4-hydroxythreonine-4-phosphate dehydrogenase [Mesonia mobilis]